MEVRGAVNGSREPEPVLDGLDHLQHEKKRLICWSQLLQPFSCFYYNCHKFPKENVGKLKNHIWLTVSASEKVEKAAAFISLR